METGATAVVTTTKTERAERSAPISEMREDDSRSIREWLDAELKGDSSVRINILRKRPMVGPGGENIAGSLETIEEMIDEDYIREMWGGGVFQLKVYTPGPKGDWKYFRGRTVKIAGPPKMHGQTLAGGQGTETLNGSHDPLAERAFDSMANLASEERAERRRLESERAKQGGMDLAALQTFNTPILEELRAARDANAVLQAKLLDATNRPAPSDPFRDRLLEKAVDGESAKLDALRTQYEARIERLIDNHAEEIKRITHSHDEQMKRIEDRHEKAIDRLESAHEREIKNLERVGDQQRDNAKTASDTRVESLQSEMKRLERDLAAAQTKIATLEAKKDQSISEKADELIKVKEALEGLGGDEDDKDQKWYEKLFDVVGNSEAALALVNKIGGGPPANNAAAQPQLPPPGVPFQTGDGNVYVRDPAGNVSMIDMATAQRLQQKQLAVARKRKRAQQAVAAASEGAGNAIEEGLADEAVPVRKPDRKEVAMAISFMESALKAPNADVRAFAATARNLIPGDVLNYLQRVGIEAFLDQAKLEIGSPLTTVRGRQFARKVFEFLTRGEIVEEPAAQPLEPVEDVEG